MAGLSIIDKLKLVMAWKRITSDPIMLEKLKSRKLWVAVLGAAVLTVGDHLGIDPALSTKIVALLSSYLLSQGIADAVAAVKK